MENHDAVAEVRPDETGDASAKPPSLGPLRYLHAAIEVIVIAMFIAIVVVAIAQVINRFFLGQSLSWSEEFQRYGHIWLVFMAISIAYRRNAHIGVDVLQLMLPRMAGSTVRLAIDVSWLAFGILLIWSASKLLGITSRQISAGLGVTMNYVYFGFVLGGGYTIICAGERLILRMLGRLS
ncbi:TRAP transporter small permease [Martelella radicis]|uniref:TRAP transporter small permease protein n=1 Tax=Martelella radicis TaxID=1397476 RepID=A0A7W6PBW2_9HYPH|nr:TRAP transporter small permease [Martelella radicis]MBB4124330.1 TRAP-type C4-dicarboxylate transport system permease small subunit [Martelella radicis]